tara:strand:- start:1509 stop:2093 length:585 start_codon:yes stop_codon:yes gene_type:complete
MEQHPTLKIKANTDNVVEFLYDSPKEGTNYYGVWRRYTLKHNGNEVGLFATDALHAKLMNFTTGDRVNIRKEEYEPNKYGWNVIPEEGTPVRNGSTPEGIDDSYKAAPSATTQETREYYKNQNDDKTKDIHRQVAFKEACKLLRFFHDNSGLLTPEELNVIALNTDNLLDILEYGHIVRQDENEPPPHTDDDLF